MADELVTPVEVVETTTDATATTTTTIDPAEVARLQAALKAANKEAADRRRKLEAYEQAENAKKEAEMSEAQKAVARAEAAEKKAQEAEAKYTAEVVKNATLAEAAKAQYGTDGKQKFIDAELAYKLVKVDNPDLAPDGVADALKALAKAYPKMLETTTQQGSNPGPAGGKKATNQTAGIKFPQANY